MGQRFEARGQIDGKSFHTDCPTFQKNYARIPRDERVSFVEHGCRPERRLATSLSRTASRSRISEPPTLSFGRGGCGSGP